MSWDGYITNLMDGSFMMDAAIVGYEKGQESVWAAHKGGDFARISAAEIRQLVNTDRSSLFSTGVTIANTKCTVLRDALHTDGQNTMDVRTKASDQNPDTFNISIGKSVKGDTLRSAPTPLPSPLFHSFTPTVHVGQKCSEGRTKNDWFREMTNQIVEEVGPSN
uniref:Profilin n=1 Tax=Paramormyrops kingsleyae TaxID=1676925 RepID=A0A3B3QH36_9TELE